jgi:hypothetical protein
MRLDWRNPFERRVANDSEAMANAYLTNYYAFLGEETAATIAASAATDAETVRGYIQAFTEVGCGELVFFPCSGAPEQADLLADAAGL